MCKGPDMLQLQSNQKSLITAWSTPVAVTRVGEKVTLCLTTLNHEICPGL